MSETTSLRKQPSRTDTNYGRLYEAIKGIRHDINTEIRTVRADISRLDSKFIEVIINQNNNEHTFLAHNSRISSLEKTVYGVAALIVTAVVSALIYTVVQKP